MRQGTWSSALLPYSYLMIGVRSGGVVEDERHHETDKRERLGQREPDVHVGPDQSGGFRLPGHGLHAVTEDQADADAGADGREAVRHRTDVDADDAFGGSSGSQEVN